MKRNGVTAQDHIHMQGTLSVAVRSVRTRRVLRRYTIRNKITFLAADVLVALLAQRAGVNEVAAYNRMFSMRMGSSNTAASRADTALGAQVIGKELTEVNVITGVPGELEFVATVESTDANGSTLCEAGLFTKGSTDNPEAVPGSTATDARMFARQIHPPIEKSLAITLEYSWRIAFSA